MKRLAQRLAYTKAKLRQLGSGLLLMARGWVEEGGGGGRRWKGN